MQILVNQDFPKRQKLAASIGRAITVFQKRQLRDLITLKYIERKKFETEADIAKRNLDTDNCPRRVKKTVNKIVDEECAREKVLITNKHQCKYDNIRQKQYGNVSKESACSIEPVNDNKKIGYYYQKCIRF